MTEFYYRLRLGTGSRIEPFSELGRYCLAALHRPLASRRRAERRPQASPTPPCAAGCGWRSARLAAAGPRTATAALRGGAAAPRRRPIRGGPRGPRHASPRPASPPGPRRPTTARRPPRILDPRPTSRPSHEAQPTRPAANGRMKEDDV